MHTSQNFTQKIITEHLRFTETWRTQKVVAHSSGLQKLLKLLSEQGKVENQFARISRLRKFVISKSQNPKI